MTTNPQSQAEEARKALGARLRQIRKLSGLTGRMLSAVSEIHFTVVSKIENGHISPTVNQVRAWCSACGAEDQTEDLLAALLTLEEAYALWKARVKEGMRFAGGRDPLAIYENTTVFRIFELSVLPGIFQTPAYTSAIVKYWGDFYGVANDANEVVKLRQRRAQAALRGTNRVLVVLTEAVLLTRYTTCDDHETQLLDLLKAIKKPNVSLGIIPFGIRVTPNSNCGFWIFDEDVVNVELPSAGVNIASPSEIAQYLKMFQNLQSQAVYGSEAKALILRCVADL